MVSAGVFLRSGSSGYVAITAGDVRMGTNDIRGFWARFPVLCFLYGKAERFSPRSLLPPDAEAVGPMSVPLPGQTAHLMNWCNVLRVRHNIEGHNKLELQHYTTDDLRRRYQENGDESIRLRDGILTRAELVAEIRWRV